MSSSNKPKSEDKKTETETSPTKKVVEFKDVEKEKLEEENNNFSDEDEEVKNVCAGCEEETAKDDNNDDAIKKYLLSIPRIKQSSQLRKQMRKELKAIKVGLGKLIFSEITIINISTIGLESGKEDRKRT